MDKKSQVEQDLEEAGVMGPKPSPSVAGDLAPYNQGQDLGKKGLVDKFKDLMNGIDPLTGKPKK